MIWMLHLPWVRYLRPRMEPQRTQKNKEREIRNPKHEIKKLASAHASKPASILDFDILILYLFVNDLTG